MQRPLGVVHTAMAAFLEQRGEGQSGHGLGYLSRSREDWKQESFLGYKKKPLATEEQLCRPVAYTPQAHANRKVALPSR